MKKFEAYDRTYHLVRQTGFKMTFANGCTASVAFGTVNYCDQGKNTAEVWAWNVFGNSVVVPGFSDGDVVAHVSPDDVLKYLAAVAAL
jgi:hypothetical protein